MSTRSKRIVIISTILLGTPVLCLLIGLVGSKLYQDHSGLSEVFSLVVGIVGTVVGAVLGSIVSFVTRNKNIGRYSLIGYLIPTGIAVLATLANPIGYLISGSR